MTGRGRKLKEVELVNGVEVSFEYLSAVEYK